MIALPGFPLINFTNRTAAATFLLLIYCTASSEKAINIKRNNRGSSDGLHGVHAVVEEVMICAAQPVRDVYVLKP